MIKVKVKSNKKNLKYFLLSVSEKDKEKYPFMNRVLIESREVKGRYKYEVPLRFFMPVINNVNKDDMCIDKCSIESYLEFADEEEGEFFYAEVATAKYMRIWREQSCPYIYKIKIDSENNTVTKIVAFKKISVRTY